MIPPIRRPLAALRRAALPAALLAATLTGCGLAAPAGHGAITLTVTRDFGRGMLDQSTEPASPRATAGSILRAALAGRPVAPRSGYRDSPRAPSGRGWFLYVNGIAAPTAPGSTPVHPGDHVWWDLHSTQSGARVHAVVGAFPEPFVHGIAGKRLPATLECAQDTRSACNRVSAALTAAGVPSASQLLGTGSGTDTLGVVVGTFADLRGEVVAALVDEGPSAGGVFARFGAGSRSLELLDGAGRVARTLNGSAGLIAGTGDPISQPTWMITGTDAVGVLAAATAFTAHALHDRFALAVQGRELIPLPVPTG